jgi:hypothetical protein
MDTRTREIYPDIQAAVDAGVPQEHLRQVDVFTIQSGPFKGRKYERLSDGSLGRRVFDAPSREVTNARHAD